MSSNRVSTVTFSKGFEGISIKEASFISGEKIKTLQTTDIVRDALSDSNTVLQGDYSLEVLKDKTVNLFKHENDEKTACTLSSNTKNKIIAAFQKQLALEKSVNPKISKLKSLETEEKGIKKTIINFLDLFFRKEIIHAKIADIATLILFLTIISMSVISIVHPGSLATLGIFNNNVLPYINLSFGITTLLVGKVLFYQSILNYQKAKKDQDKRAMRLALIQAAFSLVIIGLGTTGILGVFKISNQAVFRTLLGMCSSYMFGYGTYNLIKTIKLRKKLSDKDFDLEAFLKDMLQTQEHEQNEISKKINDLGDNRDKINEWLKKLLTKKQFEKIKAKNLDEKKDKILSTELKMLNKRKISNFESILGKSMLNKCVDFLKKSNNEKKEQMESLKKELNQALRRKLVIESVRMLSPIIGLSAFGFNLDNSLNSLNMSQNLVNIIYNSMMFISVLLTTPLNYSKKDRNVPIEDDDKRKIPKFDASSMQENLAF